METTIPFGNWPPARPPAAVTLQGQWVRLEPLSAALHSHALWQAVQGHDAVWQWLADGSYSSEQELAHSLAARQTGTAALFFAIVPGPAQVAAGYASLMRIDPANAVIEVGNVLFSPGLQRTAAATEVIFLLARHIFEELGYRRFEWKCNALNLPSRRAAERFGFAFEGIFRQHMVVKNRSRDTAWFAMLDVDWPERKQAFEAWLRPENFDENGQQRSPLRDFGGSPQQIRP